MTCGFECDASMEPYVLVYGMRNVMVTSISMYVIHL